MKNQHLVSLEIDGILYAPRHGDFLMENYEPKIIGSAKNMNIYQPTLIRPVELFQSNDDGITYKVACPNPFFTSMNSTGVHVELILGSESALMKRINSEYFVLTTSFRIRTDGSTSAAYYPIIYF